MDFYTLPHINSESLEETMYTLNYIVHKIDTYGIIEDDKEKRFVINIPEKFIKIIVNESSLILPNKEGIKYLVKPETLYISKSDFIMFGFKAIAKYTKESL